MAGVHSVQFIPFPEHTLLHSQVIPDRQWDLHLCCGLAHCAEEKTEALLGTSLAQGHISNQGRTFYPDSISSQEHSWRCEPSWVQTEVLSPLPSD